MKKYVLGFAFDNHYNSVALIKKTKPDWQAGKLNGIGGKIEDTDSSPLYAMVREFEEETGLATSPDDWKLVAILSRADEFEMHVYSSTLHNLWDVKTTTEEEVRIIPTDKVLEGSCVRTISNIRWLIGMCLDFDLSETIFSVEYQNRSGRHG